MVQIAEEGQEKRAGLEACLKDLQVIRGKVEEDYNVVDQQLTGVNTAIIDLHHQHGLPGTHTELQEALQKER